MSSKKPVRPATRFGLSDQVEKAFSHHALLEDGGDLLVGVSGGLDSMALLHLLLRLAPKHSWNLSVAHFNHQLRGGDSDGDAAFVQATCKKLGVPFYSSGGDVRGVAENQGLSIEMAARKLRHEYFAHRASKLGIKTVALAHHADDQVETFWLKFLRGSVGEALGGMSWKSRSPADENLFLIRPLLGVFKRELEEFVRNEGISFREDATNEQIDFQRNKVRRVLLPFIRNEFQPAVEGVTLRFIDIVSDEKDFLNQQAREWLRNPQPGFSSIHPALQRTVIYLQLLDIGITPEYDLIEFLRTRTGEGICFSPETHLKRDPSGTVRVERITPQEFLDENRSVDLVRPAEVKWGGVLIQTETVDYLPVAASDPHELFDAGKVGSKIVLRHWQPGDRFHPIGMHVAVKLQDWFTNLKIPSDRRRKLVVGVAERGEIFWIEGLRISENFKVTAETKNYLVWQWNRAES